MRTQSVARRNRRGEAQLEKLFEDFLTDWGWPLNGTAEIQQAFCPSVNISENKKGYSITAELPGLDEKDVHVELNDDVLTIRGEKKTEEKKEEEQYHRVERTYGSFCRSITLPSRVDDGNVKAVFKKGILTVNLPKLKEEDSGKKTINIETA